MGTRMSVATGAEFGGGGMSVAGGKADVPAAWPRLPSLAMNGLKYECWKSAIFHNQPVPKTLLRPLSKGRVYARNKNSFLESNPESMYTNKSNQNAVSYECQRMGGRWRA